MAVKLGNQHAGALHRSGMPLGTAGPCCHRGADIQRFPVDSGSTHMPAPLALATQLGNDVQSVSQQMRCRSACSTSAMPTACTCAPSAA